MEISTQQHKHCDVVSVSGRIDSATAPKLSEALEGIISVGRYKIALDMSGAEYMSSAGFRAVLSAHKACSKHNQGQVILVKVPASIFEAFELTGMTSLFKFYDDLTVAVGSF